jgi:trans-aconitate methyltransferase
MLERVFRTLARSPRLNAVLWDTQYRLGVWDRLDSGTATGGEFAKMIAEHAPSARILDLGCGTSVNLPLQPGTYRSYHGVDISPKAIKRARSLNRPDSTYEVADILAYQPARAYDAILLREVIYYLTPQQIHDLLTRLSGHLSPDGVVLIQVWSAETNPDLKAAITSTSLTLVAERTHENAVSRPTVYVLKR